MTTYGLKSRFKSIPSRVSAAIKITTQRSCSASPHWLRRQFPGCCRYRPDEGDLQRGSKRVRLVQPTITKHTHETPRNQVVEKDEIPSEVQEIAKAKRVELIEQLCEADETLCDKFLNEEPISDLDIAHALRRATTSLRFTPVFLGSAIKNTGVQPLLDGVCAYLPDPSEVNNQALDPQLPSHAPPVPLASAADAPLVGLAFKLEEGRYGQLTYMRVYQGSLKRGTVIVNSRTGKRVKVPRLVKMHSNEMEVS